MMDVVLTKTVTVDICEAEVLMTCSVLRTRVGLNTVVELAPCAFVEVLRSEVARDSASATMLKAEFETARVDIAAALGALLTSVPDASE
jgi:hypothetical protein